MVGDEEPGGHDMPDMADPEETTAMDVDEEGESGSQTDVSVAGVSGSQGVPDDEPVQSTGLIEETEGKGERFVSIYSHALSK